MNNSLAIWLCNNRWINRYIKNWNNSVGWVLANNGQKIFLDTQDISGPSFQTVRRGFDNYEKYNRSLVTQLMPDGGVFLDIGANIGHFSISVANEVPNAIIHAFEPYPKLAQCLASTINDNNLGVNLHSVALSDNSSQSTLYVNEVNLGNNSLKRAEIHKESKGQIQLNVQVEPLDSYLKLDRLDVIKIDVEGNEYETLNGAKDTVRKSKPAMLIECRNELLGDERSILPLLDQMGYQVYVPETKQLLSFDDIAKMAKSNVEKGLTHTDYAFLQEIHVKMLDI